METHIFVNEMTGVPETVQGILKENDDWWGFMTCHHGPIVSKLSKAAYVKVA